jgi:hypothetical protein
VAFTTRSVEREALLTTRHLPTHFSTPRAQHHTRRGGGRVARATCVAAALHVAPVWNNTKVSRKILKDNWPFGKQLLKTTVNLEKQLLKTSVNLEKRLLQKLAI